MLYRILNVATITFGSELQ